MLLVAATLIAFLSNDSLSGQSFTGTVTERSPDRPVPIAIVSLLTLGDSAVSVTTTTADGRFRLDVPEPGLYSVVATKLGFAPKRSDWVAFRGEESHTVELRVDEAPIELEGLRVTADRDGITEGWEKFLRRRELGRGHFVTQAEIRAAGSPPLKDIVRILPDMYMDGSGRVKSRASAGNGEAQSIGCLRFVWNDFAVAESVALKTRLAETYGIVVGAFGNGEDAILDLVTVSQAAGIEVYPSYDDVPEELRFMAWPPTGQTSGVTEPPCGLVVIWDGGAWGSGGDRLPSRP